MSKSKDEKIKMTAKYSRIVRHGDDEYIFKAGETMEVPSDVVASPFAQALIADGDLFVAGSEAVVKEESATLPQAEEIISAAKEEAEKIISAAKEEAAAIKSNAEIEAISIMEKAEESVADAKTKKGK
jgi:hypothetical protein